MEQNNSTLTPSDSLNALVTSVSPQLKSPLALLTASWNLFKTHWRVLIPITILPSLIGSVGKIFGASHNPFFDIIGGVLSIGGIILSIAAAPALIDAIHRVSRDPADTISLKGQYRFGFTYFWQFIIAVVIVALSVLGGTALLIIPGIIVGVYVSLYIYALTIDGKKGFAALIESYDLVRGRWMSVFGRALFMAIVMGIISILVGVIVSVGGTHPESLTQGISGLLTALINAAFTPLAVGYSYLVYMDLKSLRQPEISVKKFKNWLVGFMVVGIVICLALIGSIPKILQGFAS